MANFEDNTALAKHYEEVVQKKGFTLLVYPIRKYLNENLNDHPGHFAMVLGKILTFMMEGRMPEKDGGYGARKFLKDNFDFDI